MVIYIKFLKNKKKAFLNAKNLISNFLRSCGITFIIYSLNDNKNNNNLINENEKNYNSNFKFIKDIIKELNIDLSTLFTDRVSLSNNIEEINLLTHVSFASQRNPLEKPQLDYELLLLSKLLEFYMIEKCNKDLIDTSDSLNKINLADYIINNLFVNEDIYDLVNLAYINIKEKYFWNFSEIIYFIYCLHPKLLKYTILRHLKYLPSQESLLNQLVQYYYENKDFKNCKALIRV